MNESNYPARPLYQGRATIVSDYVAPSFNDLVFEAKLLIDDGTNVEYARGVLEIITSFVKSDSDHAEKAIELAKQIGLSQSVINKMYNL